MKLFQTNSPWIRLIDNIGSLVLLNLLYLLCCLPVVTAPAATTALYSCTLCMARREPLELSRFFRVFMQALLPSLTAGALLLLVVILVVFHILRKKGVIGHRRKGRHSGRHGAVAERIQPVKEWGAESENEDYVNPDTASTQDSESVQETSSEGSDA